MKDEKEHSMTAPDEPNRKIAVWRNGKFEHPTDITLPEARDNFNRLVEQEGAELADSGPAASDVKDDGEMTTQAEVNQQVALYSTPDRSLGTQGHGPREMVVHTGTPDEIIALARGSKEPVVGWTPATPEQLEEIKRATAAHDAIVASEQAQRDARLMDDLKGMLARRGKLIEGADDES